MLYNKTIPKDKEILYLINNTYPLLLCETFNPIGDILFYPEISVTIEGFNDELNLIQNKNITNYNFNNKIYNGIGIQLIDYPSKLHFRKNIEIHDMRNDVSEEGDIGFHKCGCSGCGYTMNTIFLSCGTWCPEIVKNDIYHSDLCSNYLDLLDDKYGYAAYPMCSRCWANTKIPYKIMNKK